MCPPRLSSLEQSHCRPSVSVYPAGGRRVQTLKWHRLPRTQGGQWAVLGLAHHPSPPLPPRSVCLAERMTQERVSCGLLGLLE